VVSARRCVWWRLCHHLVQGLCPCALLVLLRVVASVCVRLCACASVRASVTVLGRCPCRCPAALCVWVLAHAFVCCLVVVVCLRAFASVSLSVSTALSSRGACVCMRVFAFVVPALVYVRLCMCVWMAGSCPSL